MYLKKNIFMEIKREKENDNNNYDDELEQKEYITHGSKAKHLELRDNRFSWISEIENVFKINEKDYELTTYNKIKSNTNYFFDNLDMNINYIIIIIIIIIIFIFFFKSNIINLIFINENK